VFTLDPAKTPKLQNKSSSIQTPFLISGQVSNLATIKAILLLSFVSKVILIGRGKRRKPEFYPGSPSSKGCV